MTSREGRPNRLQETFIAVCGGFSPSLANVRRKALGAF
jgi:hypothetical protein